LIDHSRAVLHNGLGQYEPAFDAAQRASKDDSGLNMWSLPEALGIEARSRAFVSDEATAEDLYVEAIDLLEQTSLRLHRARTQLIYGEWLRRANRRVDARQQLRAAHETFTRGARKPSRRGQAVSSLRRGRRRAGGRRTHAIS
jgi:hypothetical protein